MGDYVAGVDYPVSHFYKEILKEFPDVKVGLISFFLRNKNWNMTMYQDKVDILGSYCPTIRQRKFKELTKTWHRPEVEFMIQTERQTEIATPRAPVGAKKPVPEEGIY